MVNMGSALGAVESDSVYGSHHEEMVIAYFSEREFEIQQKFAIFGFIGKGIT